MGVQHSVQATLALRTFIHTLSFLSMVDCLKTPLQLKSILFILLLVTQVFEFPISDHSTSDHFITITVHLTLKRNIKQSRYIFKENFLRLRTTKQSSRFLLTVRCQAHPVSRVYIFTICCANIPKDRDSPHRCNLCSKQFLSKHQ